MSDFLKRVGMAQAELKAPKNQYNSFGKYNYRSCEDILEAAKPINKKHGLVLLLTDKPVCIGQRYYIEATARLYDIESEQFIEATASARESDTKKGMDDSQVTGSTSSYARKYALAGLFGIDNEKDPDATNDHGKSDAPAKPATNPAAKQASAKYKQAWLAYKAKSHNEDPDAVKANFKKLVEATVKKSDMNTVTDEEWDTVMDLIVTD